MKKRLIAEGIGTYFLYLIIGMCVTPPGAGDWTPLAVGCGLAALIYSCGHISKAHFNPAVTLGFFLAGGHPAKAFLPFVLTAFLGALGAALTVGILNPEGVAAVQALEYAPLKVVLGEFAFTFALVWVILNVAIAGGTKGNSFYGIAIGGIVGAGAYAVGPLTSAAFNPAVTLGLCVNGILPWSALPLYIVVQCAAAAKAGFFFKSMGIIDPDAAER